LKKIKSKYFGGWPWGLGSGGIDGCQVNTLL
jgi:hypothetical protein